MDQGSREYLCFLFERVREAHFLRIALRGLNPPDQWRVRFIISNVSSQLGSGLLSSVALNSFLPAMNRVERFLRILILVHIIFTFSSCNSDKKTEVATFDHFEKDTTIRYAERFAIQYSKNAKLIFLRTNAKSNDTTDVFVLYDSIKPNVNFKNTHFIKTPITRIVALSSIYSNMLAELGCLNNIVAIENVDYYTNENILKACGEGKIKEVQRNPEIDREMVLKLMPEIVFAFGMNQTSNDFDPKIVQAGIPVVMCLDHLEKSPLARAEWIKFYAAFVNKSAEANNVFAEVEKDYEMLCKMAQTYTYQPNVLTELKFGDTWYVPGGKSFMAQLIHDANANYYWKDDTASGSLPLSFEAVFRRAQNADYWLNVSLCTTRDQVLSQDKRYADFAAFKKKGIYNNNLYCNKLNYSTYWETGMMFPNRILSDMIQIFHPEIKEHLKRPFYYYRQLD